MTPRRLIEPARLAGTVLRTQSDERLVDMVRDGNDRAFEAIVHRYRRPLMRYCGRFLSPARAEDAVQQAFVNAFAAIRSGDAELNLRPWLYRIAHNAALNVLRQTGFDYEQVSEQIDGVETPPQALERGERLRSVVAAVRELPERQRDAIVLQAVEGRSYDEIALELGVTDGAVRQLLNRARTTLREGVTALTPAGVVARVGGTFDAPMAERVAQTIAGAGGGAALAKGVALIAVAGAVAGGAVTHVIPGTGGGGGGSHASVAVEAADHPGGGAHAARTHVALDASHGAGHGRGHGRGAAHGHGHGDGQGRSHRGHGHSGGNGATRSGRHHEHGGSGGDGSGSSGGGQHDSGGGGSGGGDRSGSGDGGGSTTLSDDHSGSPSGTSDTSGSSGTSGDGGGGSGSGSGSGGGGSDDEGSTGTTTTTEPEPNDSLPSGSTSTTTTTIEDSGGHGGTSGGPH